MAQRTFLEQKTRFQEHTRTVGSTSAADLGGGFIVDITRQILQSRDWYFLETTSTATTTAGTGTYTLPSDLRKLRTVTLTTGTTAYPLKEITSRNDWNYIIQQPYSSDVGEYYYVEDNTVTIWPTPSTTGETITYNYRRTFADQSADGDETEFPEGYGMIPVYYAVYEYFLGQEEKQTVADRWKLRGDELMQAMMAEDGNKTTDVNVYINEFLPPNGNNYIYF
jgi:hypothetical protein